MTKDYSLDITQLPFSRRYAGCMVFYENNGEILGAENGLYLSQSTEGVLMGGAQFLRNKNYLLITPVYDGKEVPYTYAASTSKLSITGEDGKIDITFDKNGAMRVRSDKLGIRLTAKMGFGDVAMAHGRAVQVDMDGAVYFMVPQKGSAAVDSHYNLLTYRYTDPVIDFKPDNDELEIVIYDKSYADKEYPTVSEGFDECVQTMREEFARFCKDMICIPEGLEALAYGLWVAEKSFPETDGMYPSNVITDVYPKAEEQPILSLAFANADKAERLITQFQKYSTDNGLIPVSINKTKRLYQTAVMDYGTAALELLEKGTLTGEQMAAVYDMLATIDAWWTENRSEDGVRFYYAYRYECGIADSSIMKEGTPATTPDLMARMALSAVALAEYAEKIGAEASAERWKELAERRLEYLLEKLWSGNGFICWLTDDTEYKSESILCWMPLMLGKRLPEDIRRIAGRTIENDFLVTEKGLLLEKNGKEINTVIMSLIIAGLYDAGQQEAAARAAEAMKKHMSDNGLHMAYPADKLPVNRCGSLYQPAACAAVLYALSKAV